MSPGEKADILGGAMEIGEDLVLDATAAEALDQALGFGRGAGLTKWV